MAILKRYGDKPVLEPRPGLWDGVSVFNPGAILKDGRVYTQGTRDAVTPEAIRQVYGVQVILGEVQGYPIVVAHN